MSKTVPLYVTMAEQALSHADQRANAVSALVTGAALILDQDFGPEVAAQIMLNMFIQCRTTLIGEGLVAEPTRH